MKVKHLTTEEIGAKRHLHTEPLATGISIGTRFEDEAGNAYAMAASIYPGIPGENGATFPLIMLTRRELDSAIIMLNELRLSYDATVKLLEAGKSLK